MTIEDLLNNPSLSLGELQESISELNLSNTLHEFGEDVGELWDGVPGNDSFFDGGLGENDETPTDAPGTSGGDPVYLTVDGAQYSFHGGNFTYIGGGGGPAWSSGGENMDIFGTP